MGEKKLELRSTSTATTYRFLGAPGGGNWACCTVNDVTGELTITSDWGRGNWGHRWNVDHLGSPSLTHFIGDREHVDYLAGKLQGAAGGERFSPEETVARLRQEVLERRRDHARVAIADTCGTSRPAGSPLSEWMRDAVVVRGLTCSRPRHPMTRAIARELWDDLGELEDCDSLDLFFDRLPSGIHHWLSDLYEYAQNERTGEDRALRQLILPALIEACRGTVAQRAGAAPPVAQAEEVARG